MSTRLGYACINTTLRDKISCNKTCRLNTAIQKGIQSGFPEGSEEYSLAIYNFLTNMGKENLEAMYKIIAWSKNNNIFFYRISSDILPHVNNSRIKQHMLEKHYLDYFTLNFASSIIFEIGKYVQKYNIRLSMHPDHYNQLATKTQSVLDNTFTDLYWQARLLDMLEIGADAYLKYSKIDTPNDIKTGGTLCIHMGGTFKDKTESIKRWKNNFKKLPKNIQNRCCLENCEKGYCVEDLLPVCQELNIPLIFDFNHYNCWAYYHSDNPEQKPISELLPFILNTWKVVNKIPKFHLSDQAEDKKVGAHHDYVENIPEQLLNLMGKLDFDIMIEAKQKELAVLKLMKKYNL
jgi:UV DNA damage endonuclease